MRTLQLTPKVRKFLEVIPPKQFRQIVNKVFSLMENPTPNDSKKLTGYPYLRTDIGEYRIIYQFDSKSISILLIGKRNDDEIYKVLRRK